MLGGGSDEAASASVSVGSTHKWAVLPTTLGRWHPARPKPWRLTSRLPRTRRLSLVAGTPGVSWVTAMRTSWMSPTGRRPH